MRTVFISTVAVLIAALVATFAFASPQQERTPSQSDKMAQERAQRPPAAPLPDLKDCPMAKFVGTWKGTAMHRSPGQDEPTKVDMTEKAEWKLDGKAIFVEGRGVATNPDTGEEMLVHDALGIIRYEPDTRKLTFYGFKDGEPANKSELETLDNGDMRWHMQPAPTAMLRFTIHVTDDTYTEVGEFSRDAGVTYTPFLQMNLQRVE